MDFQPKFANKSRSGASSLINGEESSQTKNYNDASDSGHPDTYDEYSSIMGKGTRESALYSGNHNKEHNFQKDRAMTYTDLPYQSFDGHKRNIFPQRYGRTGDVSGDASKGSSYRNRGRGNNAYRRVYRNQHFVSNNRGRGNYFFMYEKDEICKESTVGRNRNCPSSIYGNKKRKLFCSVSKGTETVNEYGECNKTCDMPYEKSENGKDTNNNFDSKKMYENGIEKEELEDPYSEEKHTSSTSFWSGRSCIETSGIETSGIETSGIETSGMEASGMEVSGMEASGIESSGIESSGIESSGIESIGIESIGIEEDPNMCRVCKKEMYKYKCPFCEIKTCCLTCSKRHKKMFNCKNKLKKNLKIKNIGRYDFNEDILFKDFFFLQNMEKIIEGNYKYIK
ncbi:conserved Plasmodium protein, unknown function, partial [Plasmodium ovale curtisi]